jgi:hypothetical protein
MFFLLLVFWVLGGGLGSIGEEVGFEEKRSGLLL